MNLRASALALALLATGAAPLAAQGFFAAAQGGYFEAAGAERSLNALVGSSGLATFGLETGYGFRFGLYVSAGSAFFPTQKGERVFVANASAPVFKLGFPLSISRRGAYANLGWRFLQKKRLMPYAAVGGEFVFLSEESDVAGESIREDQTKGGFRFLVGLEWKATRSLHFSVEGVGSTVRDAVGVGGVSKVYGEDDIGGIALLGKVIWSPGTKSRS